MVEWMWIECGLNVFIGNWEFEEDQEKWLAGS
jgi:hypothetical protein